MNTYQELYERVQAHVLNYRGDLAFDQQSIEANPGVPFLHWTRENGTELDFHPNASDPSWPAKGERVPYLFGQADRRHILRMKVEIARYWVGKDVTCLHFDGTRFHEVTPEQAVQIAQGYQQCIEAVWAGRERHDAHLASFVHFLHPQGDLLLATG